MIDVDNAIFAYRTRHDAYCCKFCGDGETEEVRVYNRLLMKKVPSGIYSKVLCYSADTENKRPIATPQASYSYSYGYIYPNAQSHADYFDIVQLDIVKRRLELPPDENQKQKWLGRLLGSGMSKNIVTIDSLYEIPICDDCLMKTQNEYSVIMTIALVC